MTTVGAGNGIDDRYLIAHYFIALVWYQDFPKAGVAALVELGFVGESLPRAFLQA